MFSFLLYSPPWTEKLVRPATTRTTIAKRIMGFSFIGKDQHKQGHTGRTEPARIGAAKGFFAAEVGFRKAPGTPWRSTARSGEARPGKGG
jgi:hypothetical protein